MKKRLLIIFVSMLFVMVCLCACKPNDKPNDKEPSDKEQTDASWAGYLSSEIYHDSYYDTLDRAVEGFLENELSGSFDDMEISVESKGYEKTSDLTQDEINKLTIDEEIKASIKHAELGKISYESKTIISGDTETIKGPFQSARSLIIIQFDDGYDYYALAAKEGEFATQIEFYSFYNPKNGTVTYKAQQKIGNEEIEIETKAFFTEDGFYGEYTRGKTSPYKVYAYRTENGCECYIM